MSRLRPPRGFILLYVVALVAALTMILLQLQQRHAVPGQSERELGHVLQRQEGAVLLDFVIAGLRDQKLAADPRYNTFRRLLAEDPARINALEDALAQLKAMLDQLGFVIDLRRGGGPGLANSPDNEGVLFIPRSDPPYSIRLGEREYLVSILLNNARPNLNSLPYENLWRYLEYLGLPQDEAKDLAANIVDWRDEDDFRTDGRGAERDYYLGLSDPYTPRNAPIRSWQELAYVKGVTPDRLILLRDKFSLGDPNWNGVLGDHLKPEALAALCGLRLDTVKAILKAYGRLPGDKDGADVTTLPITAQDTAAFDAIVAWKENLDRLRIEVAGSHALLHAEYDTRDHRVVARW